MYQGDVFFFACHRKDAEPTMANKCTRQSLIEACCYHRTRLSTGSVDELRTASLQGKALALSFHCFPWLMKKEQQYVKAGT